MLNSFINSTVATRLHRLALPTILLAALSSSAFVAGCKKHSESDGHDHSTKSPSKPHQHAPHDDHDHDEHADEVTLSPEAIARYGVKTEAATLRVLRPTFIASGRVAFNAEAVAHVGSPLRGRVTEIKFRLGDAVKRGDTLLIIESPELGEAQAEYLQRRVGVEAATAPLELAKAAWERAKGLYEQSQGIALTEVARREAEYMAAVAALQSAQASVHVSENRLLLLGMSRSAIEQLSKSEQLTPQHAIAAPIDGQVIERAVTQGELVSLDRESLLVLADTRTLWLLADVPESRLGEIAIGAPARVSVGSASAPTHIGGKIDFIAQTIDPQTRTAQVRIEVPSDAQALRPGMFAQVEIATSGPATQGSTPVIAVPDEAIQTVEGGPAVFVPVEGEPGTFAKRAVKVGPALGGMVPILSGLADGEAFVVSGTFILKAELGKAGAGHQH